MLRSLVLLSLIASLSASGTAPGDVLRVYAGCAGGATVESQQGIQVGLTKGTGNAQTIDVRVLPEAWPTVRQVRVECGDADALLTLGVRGGSVVFVPVARGSPAG